MQLFSHSLQKFHSFFYNDETKTELSDRQTEISSSSNYTVGYIVLGE